LILKLLAEAKTLPTSLTCAVLTAAQRADHAALLAVCGLDSANKPSLATAMAQWLGRAQDPLAEETLMKLSQLHPSDREARTAIATSLGAIGSARAVSALLPMTKGLIHNESHQAAKSAIRQIQSRLGNVKAGWISVAPIDERAGAVSVAPASGEVSLAPRDDVEE
jgi:HEAT repeat protein